MSALLEVDDPIDECAELARGMATTRCRRDPRTGESCAWYHGLWSDLRAVGLGSRVSYQADFLGRIVPLVTRQRPRVLVAGAADHAILAHVLAACDAHAIAPQVTILDRCETPLRLNEWYATRVGRSIATRHADMFEHRPSDPYDLIVAHSFIGYFPPERRQSLFLHWSAMLAPSGVLAVVNRVREGDPRAFLTFGAREAAAFRAAAEARLRPRLSAAALVAQLDRAGAYVRNHGVHPLPREELSSLFASAGLRVDVSLDVAASDDRNRELAGVAVVSNATYACVAGTRSDQLRQK